MLCQKFPAVQNFVYLLHLAHQTLHSYVVRILLLCTKLPIVLMSETYTLITYIGSCTNIHSIFPPVHTITNLLAHQHVVHSNMPPGEGRIDPGLAVIAVAKLRSLIKSPNTATSSVS